MEVAALLEIMRSFVRNRIAKLLEDNVCLHMIGDRTAFDEDLQILFKNAEAQTANCTGLTLTVAINYGGQQDILQAISEAQKQFSGEEISSDMIKSCLMTSHLPPVDLLIRTGGEKRVSNFRLWDLSYAELYFSEVLWPDFNKEHFEEAITSYQKRERRFGKTSEQLKA